MLSVLNRISKWEAVMRKPYPGSVVHFPGIKTDVATIYDYSGNGNHGAITGAVLDRLPSGVPYLTFDGNDLITITDHATLDLTGDFGIIMWVNMAAGAAVQDLLDKTSVAEGYGYTLRTTGQPSFFINNGAYKDATAAITNNIWQQIAVTYDGANANHFLNGAPNGSPALVGAISTNNGNVILGRASSGAANFMTGKMAVPIRLITPAPTATTIAEFYKQEAPFFRN